MMAFKLWVEGSRRATGGQSFRPGLDWCVGEKGHLSAGWGILQIQVSGFLFKLE